MINMKSKNFKNKIIDKIYKKELNIKLLGICFNMLIIINSLGKKILSVRKVKHWRIHDNLEIDDKFYKYNFVKKSGIEEQNF